MRLIVLGSSGMLGQQVARESWIAGIETVEVSRGAPWQFDYGVSSFADLSEALELGRDDLVVNCIGWIPQKKSSSEIRNQQDARRLNVDLIAEIAMAREKLSFRWLQIATDCVFSGEHGSYSELDDKSPIDLYGETKAEGEQLMSGASVVRCSIVGPDGNHRSGLYEWLKGAPRNSSVQGFTNHLWNGVSTLAFSRLAIGLARTYELEPFVQHWIPSDSVSKFQLISAFAHHLGRFDISISPSEEGANRDRTLSTVDRARNRDLWLLAGYKSVPVIEELLDEFIAHDKRETNGKCKDSD
jgi:dTDP-4-dehydrorhamnose reductase